MTASTIPPHEQSDNTDNTESRAHTPPDWWDHHRPITSDEYSDMALMLGALSILTFWMFGLGIVLFTKIESDVHLDHILFGNMLGVDWGEVVEAGAIALLVGGVLIAKWRDLLLHAFDPQQARAIGLSTRLLHYGLLCILALTIVGALRATGIILTIAMLIAPGAIAFLLTDRFARMLPIAVLVAVGATFTGVWLSFFLDSAPAPTIVLVLTAIFVVVFVARSRRTGRHGALAVD